MSGMTVGSGVVMCSVSEMRGVCWSDIHAREVVRSRVLFVVSFCCGG